MNIRLPSGPVNLTAPGWIGLLTLCGGAKMLLSAGVELGKDEAAYVYWGQHLDASFALLPFALFGLFHGLAPGVEWVVRLVPVLSGAASTVLLFHLCRLHGVSTAQALWATAALASSHWFWHTTSYLHPDGPFVACWLLTLIAARRCWYGGASTVHRRHLAQVGAAAGLTILCKYSGAFLVIGLLLWIPIARRGSRWSEFWWVALPLALITAPLIYAQVASHFFLPTTLTTLSAIISSTNLFARLALFGLNPLLFVSPLCLYLLYRTLAMLLIGEWHELAQRRPGGEILLALLPSLCLLLAFAAFALTRGQIKGNWVLPAFLGLLPFAFARANLPSARRLFLWSLVGTNLLQAIAIGGALRFPGIVGEVESALEVSSLNDSYTLLVAVEDRRREVAFSWTERLCEYRGWRRLASELEERLAMTETTSDRPLVSSQYGVVFGLAYYGAGQRAYFTVDDPRFRDLTDLFASNGVDLPSQILFVARTGTALPVSLLRHYEAMEVVIRLPRREEGCSPIQYDAQHLQLR